MRWLLVVAVLLALAIPAAPASAQTGASTEITIDTPAASATAANGTQLLIGGWAVDRAATSGTGIDHVRIVLDGLMDAGGTLLGSATIGKSRPDVAQALGNPAFSTAGFDYLWTPTNLSAGTHTIYVYAHATASNTWSYKSVPVVVTAAPTPPPRPPGGGPGSWPGWGGPGGGSGWPGWWVPPPPPPPPPPGPICIQIYPPPPGCGIGMLPAPTNLVASVVTPVSVTLTWTAVPGAVSYRVLQSTGATPFGQANATSVSTISATVTGLTAGTTYRFQVVAVDGFGQQGMPSAPITVTTTTPVVNPLGPVVPFGAETAPMGPLGPLGPGGPPRPPMMR
jgi:hypothetical protein